MKSGKVKEIPSCPCGFLFMLVELNYEKGGRRKKRGRERKEERKRGEDNQREKGGGKQGDDSNYE
jgi:hypothetical protein